MNMTRNPIKLIAATGALALAAAAANAATTPTWDFAADDLVGWSVTTGFHAFEGNGVEPAEANGTRAHDAVHPVFILSSPTVNFNGANVHASDSVIDVIWEGGQGNQGGTPNPLNQAEIMGYNGGTTDGNGQKGLGFLNLSTLNYDFVSFDSANGGGVETLSYTYGDLIAGGVDPNVSYQLDFYTTDSGGWGWTRLDAVHLDPGAVGAVPEPTSSALIALSGLALLFRRRR